MFRNVILLVLSALCTATAAAQGDATARSIDIEQVEIAASRPMKQIGVQRTLIDSTVLRENIT